MIVKRTLSSSRRTHATFPSEEREAVSSDTTNQFYLFKAAAAGELTGEGVYVLDRSFKPHREGEDCIMAGGNVDAFSRKKVSMDVLALIFELPISSPFILDYCLHPEVKGPSEADIQRCL